MKNIIRTLDIGEAKARLPELVDQASREEPFLIAKGGKPLVKVSAVEGSASARPRRLGFLAGQLAVPDDFDLLGASEIERMFDGEK